MQNTKVTKLSIKKISEFDPKTIVFPNEYKLYKSELIQKSLSIKVKANEEGDNPVPGFRSSQPRFSFGFKGFEKGGWSVHLSFGPTRESLPGSKTHKAQKKELSVMKETQKILKNRVSDELEGRKFLFLREGDDEEFGKEYSSYFKVLPGQTQIRIGNKSYKTGEDLEKISGRAIDVDMVAFELGKISVCPKVVSVKPKLVYLLGKFKNQDVLHQEWSEIFREDEESEEDEDLLN